MRARPILPAVIAVALTTAGFVAVHPTQVTSAEAAPSTVRFQADASSTVPVQDQLSAALADAAKRGSAVALPAGSLTVTRPLWLPTGSSLVLDTGAVITGAVSGQSLVRMTTGSRLAGGRIENTATADCFDVDFAGGTHDAAISGVAFAGARTNSVYLGAPDLHDVSVTGSTFDGVVYGVLLNSGAVRSSRVTVAGNTFSRIAADAIEINSAMPATADQITGVVITGNTVRSMTGAGGGAGFGVGLAGVHDFTVSDNSIFGARNEAVHIEDRSSRGVVSGNVVQNGGIGSRPAVAIYKTVDTVEIRNNSIRGFSGHGIAVLWDSIGSSRNITISGNTVASVTGSGVVVAGDAGTGPFFVRGNDISAAGRFGVEVLGIHPLSVVEHNRIRDAGLGLISTRFQGTGVRQYTDNGPDATLSASASASANSALSSSARSSSAQARVVARG